MAHRILIADDDPQILSMLGNYLQRMLGYQVVRVETGEAALDAALTQEFHLCILDVRLPGISGAETYARLKHTLPDIEAIFFTADHDFGSSMDFLRFSLPRERVLVKPMTDWSSFTKLIIGILGPPTA